ncbi:MAG: glycerophosphodiester phosphodiesterase [Sphingobium sp.]|nr:MAG: glycerophosphodiester phosphodiesterase [Sphingobium sp.]
MMLRGVFHAGLLFLMSLAPIAAAAADPILIAHRGASGERPEHTLASYERAIDEGADYIEPDLVLTKDGILVARHENEIGGTTDVAEHPEFAERKTTKTIDGAAVTGWFTEDFTLAELRTLRARERLPDLRPANVRFNDLYLIPTFEEILKLVRAKEAEMHRRIGIYPETKHPTYFAKLGLPHQDALLTLLSKYGYETQADPVFIQSFEVGNLKALRAATRLRLIQLVDAEGGPADLPGSTYADMLTLQGLKDIATYADGIGPSAVQVVAPEGPTALVGRAHDAGLQVHVWTLRMENPFLPEQYRRPDDPQGRGDFTGWVRAIVASGVDGFFSDFPGQARAVLKP